MGTLKDLIAYQKAFYLAMEIFRISQGFPKEEQYSLTDQIRRCSRSVCANLAEAYRKRRYPNHFSANYPMRILKTEKLKPGLNFHWPAAM